MKKFFLPKCMNKLKNKYQPKFRNLAEQNYAHEFIRDWRILIQCNHRYPYHDFHLE